MIRDDIGREREKKKGKGADLSQQGRRGKAESLFFPHVAGKEKKKKEAWRLSSPGDGGKSKKR